MELYLKSLSLTQNSSLTDVGYSCIKLLDWAQKTSSIDRISAKDIECLGKCIIFLNACYEKFHEELPKYLVETYPWYGQQIQTFFSNSINFPRNLTNILENMATKENSASNIFILKSVLQSFYQQKEISLDYTALDFIDLNKTEVPENRLKMLRLMQQLLMLPIKQINLALNKALEYIPFDIIGHVFVEPTDSYYSDFCIIVSEKICKQFMDFTINEYFVRSLYVNTCISQKGKEFYWRCLGNCDFALSLKTFLFAILEQVFNENSEYLENPEVCIYKKHKLSQILYLIWSAMAPQSPCRHDLCNSIIGTNIANDIFELLNRYESIFSLY